MATGEVLVTAPSMGYGHLRAAASVADALGVAPRRSDRPPLAGGQDLRTWDRIRDFYEGLSRLSQQPFAGRPAHWFLEWITAIPHLHPERDLADPTRSAHTMERFAGQGFGRTLVRHLEECDATLVTTFYAEAIVADRAGRRRVFCVVTDADVNRVWAPMRGVTTRIRYFAPTRRVVRRLCAYGVPASRIAFTGFPLPPELVGSSDDGPLERNLARRLAALDPHGLFRRRLETNAHASLLPLSRDPEGHPPLVVFAIGGAGAQMDLARRLVAGMRAAVREGRLRLALVAGTREDVAERLHEIVDEARLTPHVRVLHERDFAAYYRAFNALLADADVLWTKPGELVFYAGLGLPLVLSPPVGVQERANARWVLDRGGAVRQHDPRHAGSWLGEMIEDGLLAGAAWSGFLRLPYDGARRIAAAVRAETAAS